MKASPTRVVADAGAAGGVAVATGNAMGMVKRHSIRANPGQSRKCSMRSRKTMLPALTAHRPIRRRHRSKTALLHPQRKASPPRKRTGAVAPTLDHPGAGSIRRRRRTGYIVRLFTADSGDFQHECGGIRNTQARLVGQTPARRQRLAAR